MTPRWVSSALGSGGIAINKTKEQPCTPGVYLLLGE